MTPWTAAHQTSLSFTISRSLLKFMSIELVMLSNHSHWEDSMDTRMAGYSPWGCKELDTTERLTLSLGQLVQFSCSVVSDSLRPHGLQHARPPCPSPTPGVITNWEKFSTYITRYLLNPRFLCLLHCRRILYLWSYRGSP